MKRCVDAILFALLTAVLLPGGAWAHEFSLGLYASGADAHERIVSAARGALIAADERDGHPDETSDGHLGGLDVHIVPMPDGVPITLPDLINAHRDGLDFLLVLDSDLALSEPLHGVSDDTIIFGPGTLPSSDLWSDTDGLHGFAGRYQSTWSDAPGIHAAQGYNAALRLDLAVRPHGGVDDKGAVEQALRATESGIDW